VASWLETGKSIENFFLQCTVKKYISRILGLRNIEKLIQNKLHSFLKSVYGHMSMLPEEVVSAYGNETPSMERRGVRSCLLFVSNILHLMSGLLQHREVLQYTSAVQGKVRLFPVR
jgi:hypothetical protein